MKKSFYLFVLTFRGGDWSDPKVRFAEEVFYEHNFPKQCMDFNELSSYIEMYATENLTTETFDNLWDLYEEYVKRA
ncbi:YozE family protein [Lysinibacillus sp. NPDC097287]|uniref:YozE family protein n=1 Tax=Lysinibacillus sp. NPDC097287 TaxID=3364144 RepID=UPI0038234B85